MSMSNSKLLIPPIPGVKMLPQPMPIITTDDCSVDQHFSKAELEKISPYEKKRYLNLKRNYLMLLSLGLPVTKPDFMKGPAFRKRRQKKVESDSDSDEEWTPMKKQAAKKDKLFKVPLVKPNNAVSSTEGPARKKRKTKNSKEKQEEKSIPPTANYFWRERKLTNFMNVESPDDDSFLYCEECNKEYDEDCPIHGALLIIEDPQVSQIGKNVTMAEASLPECLTIKMSAIPNAGNGIFASSAIVPRTRFGPYKGRVVKDIDEAHATGYSWQICQDGKPSHFVDASDPNNSNWMRFVNCARSDAEQNLTAFQYRGEVYYRSHCTILPGQELLVWYGGDYGNELGITRNKPTSKPSDGVYTVVSKSGETLYGCGQCPGIQFVYEKYLVSHMLKVHRVKLLADWKPEKENCHAKNSRANSCIRNGLMLGARNDLHKNNKTETCFQCTMCDYRCSQKHHLTTHMRTHSGEQPFQCTMCDYRFSHKCALTTHMRTHTGEQPFQCTMCDYRCSDKGNLTRHMRTHTGEQPFRCTMCDYRCSHKPHLTRHMRTHTGEQPFRCTMCDYRCSVNGSLTTHMRTHTGEQPFQCTMCDYRCSVKGNLTRHMRTHTGEQPFQCTMCDKRFSQKGDLTKHMRTHTGEQPFQCTMCDYRCSVKSNLITHMRTHSGEKPFQCTMCDYRCSQKKNLTTHMRTHSGEKPFQCKMCDYRCSEKGSLTRHMRTHTERKLTSNNSKQLRESATTKNKISKIEE